MPCLFDFGQAIIGSIPVFWREMFKPVIKSGIQAKWSLIKCDRQRHKWWAILEEEFAWNLFITKQISKHIKIELLKVENKLKMKSIRRRVFS